MRRKSAVKSARQSLPVTRFVRWSCLGAGFFWVMLLWSVHAKADESPEAVLKRLQATYAALTSYLDTGTVLIEYAPGSSDQHRFTTYFKRVPRHFLFDYRKQGGDRLTVWGDPEAFHRWWQSTGENADYPNPNNTLAFSLSDYPTAGTSSKIASLLYHNAALVSSLSNFTATRLDSSEEIGGQKCYRLVGQSGDVYAATAREVNVRALTLWIDVKSGLLRQIREEGKAAPGTLDRTTTTFDPKANPTIPDSSFKFVPPASQ